MVVQGIASSPDTELFGRIMCWIRRSQNLSEVLAATVEEVGQFLNCDRVKIYQFLPDETGRVVAEWIREQRLPSLLGLTFPADDIPPHARELFIKTRARSIVNLSERQIGQSGIDPTAPEEVRFRPLDSCHAEYLSAMGVQSSLVIPILQEATLWGLLVIHHAEPRTLSEGQIETLQLSVDLLTVAIAQFTLIEQTHAKATRESNLNQIAGLLHSLSTIELQAALDCTVSALNGSGGRLWVYAKSLAIEPNVYDPQLPSNCVRLFCSGSQPTMPENAPYSVLEEYSAWKDRFRSEQDPIWTIADLYKESALRNLQPAFRSTDIRGLVIVPLWYRQQLLGFLTVFRDEIETEILWAGQVDPDQRQLYPRQSFEVWKETCRGNIEPWSATDLKFVSAIAQQFSTAIQQYETHQQLQGLNANLELQVQERTARLEQATEQQQVLFNVVTEMRKSLQIETIFATVTQALRRSLNVDRVCIYQFDLANHYNTGKVIAEEVTKPFSAALGTTFEDRCFGEKYAIRYQNGRVSAIADITQSAVHSCYQAMLDRYAIKASITAPILRGESLWGLLCVHQCDRPRDWTEAEIRFVTQVSVQLSIALEQAELLRQTNEQAEQLIEALSTLQRTQTQLIQTEKMSSLGQLVAGVAHEINNPVNFIYGNLNHIQSYASALLSLIETYQACYPEPQAEILEQSDAIDLEFLREDLPKTLSSLQVGTERIRQIVLSLRNFSRLDEAEFKEVDIHEGIDNTLLILQHRLSSNSKVIKEFGELPLIECYAGQLNQVFMNLLSNAIDAIEETDQATPCIWITTKQIEPNRVAICIRDNGAGIPEQVRSRIFDPFFTTKPIGKGTGIGLAISYEIVVQKHKGTIQCISEPDQGTEFWIEIPICQH
ncbi:GAF domain-containing protein [Leptolyngbya sp. AN03gr2]|uniref:GAF domain-containing sensor histidine kinase n=1 Tax=unclassified Leptolyngbya TaxID=2650499 RepID=UPI003D3143F1